MKAPQVTYLCLTTAFWILGIVFVFVANNGTENYQNANAGGAMIVTLLVGVNTGLLMWGGFFRSRD